MTKTKLHGSATCHFCEQCLFAGDEAYVGRVIVCVDCRKREDEKADQEWQDATPAE